jgi:hypothetical protein
MSRTVNRSATSLILTVRLATIADDPITGIAFNNGDLEVAWLNSESTDWTVVTLVAGTIGEYVENGWIHVGDGVYQYCLPNAAIEPGDRTTLRITYDTNPPQYDAIDAVVYTPTEIGSQVSVALQNVRLSLQQQLTLDGTTDLVVIQGDDYTRSGVRIDLVTESLDDPDMDLSTYHLIIAANTGSSAQKIVLRADILGAPGSHYAIFNPPSTMTELWPTGTFPLLYRIEWDANEYQTIDAEGLLTVNPFDTVPADIVNLPTPP